MFKKKNRKQPKMMRRRPNNEYEFGDDAVSDCIGMFYSGFKGLSHPSTARRGNAFGMAGMAVAVFTTVALIVKLKNEAGGGGSGYDLVAFGVLVGAVWCDFGQARRDDQDARIGCSDAFLDRFGGSLYRRRRGVRTVDLQYHDA